MKKAAFGLGVAVLFLAGLALRLRSYRAGLVEIGDFQREPCDGDGRWPFLTSAQVLDLGWAYRLPPPKPAPGALIAPLGSYVYAPEKKGRVVRAGLFGDSFVAGDETGPGLDPASQLQDLFAKAGYRASVVNFGVNAYGLHQSALLCRLLARRFGLDYAVFFSYPHDYERDDTFVFSRNYGPLHARYALDGGKPVLVPVSGADRCDAARRYNGLLPPWRYWRYDLRPPMALRALLPGGSWRRGLNPFYYALRHEREMDSIYAGLFSELAAEVPHVLVISPDPRARRWAGPDVYVVSREEAGGQAELYAAPRSHPSPLAQWSRARQLFALLTGQERAGFDVLELSPPAATSGRVVSPQGHAPIERAYLSVGGRRLASLVAPIDLPPYHLYEEPERIAPGTRSFIAVDEARLTLIPGQALLRGSEPAFLVLSSGVESLRLAAADVRPLSPRTGWLAPRPGPWRGVWADGTACEASSSGADWLSGLRLSCAKPVDSLRLATPTRVLARLKKDGRGYSLEPDSGILYSVRSHDGDFADPDSLPSSGAVSLTITTAGRTLAYPLAGYRKRRVELAPFPRAGRPAALARLSS